MGSNGQPGEPDAPLDAPLVDETTLQQLKARLSSEDLARFLQSAIQEAEEALKRIQLTASSAEIAEEAHKLKGSAGLLGLGRINVIVSRIIRAATDGCDFPDLLDALGTAISATREEIARRAHRSDA